ncbi:MAG: hypothetical protein GY820_48395 [Gammaproteobacteria bacterium]|nr:hypothetical protein [Gammaproteobacteria bacterium]
MGDLSFKENFENFRFPQNWSIMEPIDAERLGEQEKHNLKAVSATGRELEPH